MSNIIRRHTDNMKLLILCILLLLQSFLFPRFYLYLWVYDFIPVKYSNLCIFNFYMCLFLFYFYVCSSASCHSSANLPEVFPSFLNCCKENSRLKPAKKGHGPQTPKLFVLFFILFVLWRSVYCVCLNVYSITATGCLGNCS